MEEGIGLCDPYAGDNSSIPNHNSTLNQSDNAQSEQWDEGNYEYKMYLERMVDGYATLVMVCLGLMFNSCSALVFLRSKRKPIIYYYLFSLSLWDSLLLLSALLMYAIPTLVYGPNWDRTSGNYNYTVPFWYAIGNMTLVGPLWVVLALTLDRYAALCHPFWHIQHMVDRRNVKIILAFVSCFAVVYGIPRYFEVEVQHCYSVPPQLPPLQPAQPLQTSQSVQSWLTVSPTQVPDGLLDHLHLAPGAGAGAEAGEGPDDLLARPTQVLPVDSGSRIGIVQEHVRNLSGSTTSIINGKNVKGQGQGQGQIIAVLGQTTLIGNNFYLYTYKIIGGLLLYSALPFCFLFGLTVRISIELRRSLASLQSMRTGGSLPPSRSTHSVKNSLSGDVAMGAIRAERTISGAKPANGTGESTTAANLNSSYQGSGASNSSGRQKSAAGASAMLAVPQSDTHSTRPVTRDRLTSTCSSQAVPLMPKKQKKRKYSEDRTNIMLLAVIVKYLLSHVTPTALDLIHIFGSERVVYSLWVEYLVMWSNFVVTLNCTCNMWIYLAGSVSFRRELLSMFWKRKENDAASKQYMNGTTSFRNTRASHSYQSPLQYNTSVAL